MSIRKTRLSFHSNIFQRFRFLAAVDSTSLASAGSALPSLESESAPSFASASSTAANAESVRWSTSYDVGFYSKKPTHEIDKSTLQQLLQNPWVPPPGYQFPYSSHTKQGKEERRFVGRHHLEKYEWLTFSDMDQGLYCKYCPFFGRSEVGRNRMQMGILVRSPMIKFAKLLGAKGDLQEHASTQYHVAAVDAAKEFLRSQQNPDLCIHQQLNTQHAIEVAENRERLKCSLQNVIFLGRQGLPLRGHRETENGPGASESGSGNRGNFLELMSFRKECGDLKVEKQMSSCDKNKRAVWKSKVIQDDLIEACGQEITETIVRRVEKTKFYSALFDETTDNSHTSQLSLSVRYPYIDEEKEKLTVREDFVVFVDPRKVLEEMEIKEYSDASASADEEDDDPDSGTGAADTDDLEQAITGIKLGQVTITSLVKLGFNPDYCVGVGADGCAVNTSETVGAIQEIQKTAKNAVRAPCYNHALNLSISKSSAVPSVKKAVHIMKEVGSFFRASAKRHKRLLKVFNRTLPALCETRWVQRHEAVQVFLQGISEITEALQTISKWQDRETAGKASSLLNNIHQPEFLVTLVSLQDVLASTVSLSRFLQKETIEMQQASDAVQDTISILEEKRQNSEEVFGVLYNEVLELASKFDVEIHLPRAAGRSRHPTQDAESFYRQTVYNTILDNITRDLKQRLSAEVLECYDLNKLLPLEVLKLDETTANEKLGQFAAKYSDLLDTPEHILLQNLKVIINKLTQINKSQSNHLNLKLIYLRVF